MSIYLFNIFNESKDNDHITTMLTCSDKNPRFFKKTLSFTTSKNFYIVSNSLLYLRKYLINQNENCIFMTRKDWRLCDQNKQFVAILQKKIIFIFLTLILLFPKILSTVIFHLAAVLQRYQIYQILFNACKVMLAQKISAMNKKSFVSYLLCHCGNPKGK